MIIFVNGKPTSLNNNKPNGIQFLSGKAWPILGDYVAKLKTSPWQVYIN